MVINVEVRGLNEAIATIQGVPPASKAQVSRFVGRTAAAVERYWKIALSGPGSARRLAVRTGRLRSSVRTLREGPSQARVGTDTTYAAIHEFGGRTRPHVIRPRTGKVLAWKGGDGAMRFAREVRHPGSLIPPRPHRGPALRAVRPVIDLIAQDAARDVIREADAKARLVAGGVA